MRCGKILRSFLLVFLLLLSVYCYSLSPEEKEALKGLDKPLLILIILEYEQGMTDLENSMIEREKETEKRKTASDLKENRLNERDREQNEREKLLVIQETLYQESLVLHEIKLKKTKFLYGSGGLIIGFLMGFPMGYLEN